MFTEQVLNVVEVTKYYGAKLILDRVSLSLNRGERVGLVGENGIGKTTLARIITGELAPDEGKVRFPSAAEIGYLPQEASFEDGATVRQLLDHALGALDELRATLELMEAQMPEIPRSELTAYLAEYGQLQEEFSQRGGYDAEYRIDQVFAGLDLTHIDRSRLTNTLSGGEKTRVMLANLLLAAPGLLILDEPTNHLDFAALDWLENYLLSYPGAMLVISHDRRFLNKVVNRIVELSPSDHKLTVYPGNYEFYLAEREKQQVKQIAAYEEQQEEIKSLRRLIKGKTYSAPAGKPASDGDKMAYDFHGGKVDKRVSREISVAKRRLDEIDSNLIHRPTHRWQISPDFAPIESVSQQVIQITDLAKVMAGEVLFQGVTATINRGERVVFYGPNGIGKTTLLKLILGLDTPERGTIKLAPGVRIGYLDQEQESLDSTRTVLEDFGREIPGSEAELRSALHRYSLFNEDQALQPIGSLSIGQKRKLQIAKLIAQRANVLLLDEPTNHLDLESVEQFEQALREFSETSGGTILAISHDRTFIDKVATVTWSLEGGRLSVNHPSSGERRPASR